MCNVSLAMPRRRTKDAEAWKVARLLRSARKLTPLYACETSNAAAAAFVTGVSDRLACSAGWGGRAGSTQWPVDRGRKSVVIKAQGRSAK